MKQYETNSEAAQVAQAQHDALAKFAIWADVGVTLVVMGAMYFDSRSAIVAVLSGVTFFLFFGSLVILTLSGTLKEVIVNGQNNRTQRIMLRLQYDLSNTPTVSLVDAPRLPLHRESAQPQLVESRRFVPAHDDSAEREAAAWLLTLYRKDGELDPKKVLLQSEKERPGRIRVAAPSRPAKELLLARRIIADVGNGYRLSLKRCSTVQDALSQLSPLYVLPGTPPHHPLPQGNLEVGL